MSDQIGFYSSRPLTDKEAEIELRRELKQIDLPFPLSSHRLQVALRLLENLEKLAAECPKREPKQSDFFNGTTFEAIMADWRAGELARIAIKNAEKGED